MFKQCGKLYWFYFVRNAIFANPLSFVLKKDQQTFLTIFIHFYDQQLRLSVKNFHIQRYFLSIGCNFVSNSLFKDILSRKDEADAKRNVLNVLHRYRFLFNLPRSIEKNIQQVGYVINIEMKHSSSFTIPPSKFLSGDNFSRKKHRLLDS